MLRTNGPPVKSDIQRAVNSVIKENSNFDRNENRSAHRENLVRPVTIAIREMDESLTGFSRNISATGAGLITSEPIPENSTGEIAISRLSGLSLKLLSECRWCKPYGEGWFLSGWQFIVLRR